MNQYKKLRIWQESVALAVDVCKTTRSFPKEEIFGLTSQIRRSGISVPSNIAEGSCRNNEGEFKQFLGIASGSAGELDTQLFIAKELEFLTENDYVNYSNRIEIVQKMNYNLQKTLTSKTPKKAPKAIIE